MSAIDELNDTLSINATSGSIDTVDEADSLSIDSTGSNVKTRINMNQTKKPNHKFIKQELKRSPESAGAVKLSGGTKRVVNVSDIPTKPEPEVQEVHVSPMDDMLGVDNPDSMLSKWMKNKEEEAKEWIAEKEEEAAVNEDDDSELDGKSIGEEFETVVDKRILVEDDDLDIDISSNDDDEINEETNDMSPNENEINEIIENLEIEEDEELDLTIDDEEEKGEILSDNSAGIDSDATEHQVVEVEEESYSLEDLDIEESTETTEAPVVVEDSDEDEIKEAEEDSDEDILKNLQKMITEKIKPVSTQLDLSTFTIVKKPITNINNYIADVSSRVIKWVLPNQAAIVKMKDFTGAELEKLREYSENSRSIDSLNRRFKLIYDHIVSPKPADFNTWLKCTPFSDVDHYFFAIYIANYKGANFLPIDCSNEKCKNTWVTDDINIMELVKFEKPEDKKKFEQIYHSEATAATGKGLYVTQVVPITDKFAVAFKEPSIYNIIEDRLIDTNTRNKYSSFIDYMPYIDTVYAIDYETHGLIPITYKRFADNAAKDVKSKINKYSAVFSTFNSDAFGIIKAYARAISERNDGISYNYPELTCPKCGSVIKSEPVSAEALVFTRYQLGSLTSTLLS